jgi:hypothetical protein
MSTIRTAARRALAKRVLSDKYFDNLKLRAENGELPPQVETLLLHYLVGKPTEEMEVVDNGNDLQDMTTEQLLAAAQEIQQTLARAVSEQETVPPVQEAPADIPPTTGSVH